MPVACRNRRGSPAGERIHKYFLDKPDVGREYTLSSKLPQKDQSVRIGLFVRLGIWRADSNGPGHPLLQLRCNSP